MMRDREMMSGWAVALHWFWMGLILAILILTIAALIKYLMK